jgi:hypothetical protein
MITIRSSGPRDAADGYVRHTAHIGATGIDDIWFMIPGDAQPVSEDWLLPVGIVVGMALGEDVHIAGRVSESLFDSADEIQRITEHRHDTLTRVRVTADEVGPAPESPQAHVASCFSCGVDSFHTVLDPEQGIDSLLYVHGLEALVGDERMLALVLPRVRDAAAELGLPLRLAETNWRTVVEPVAGHDYFASIPLIFAVAHLMGSDVTRLVLPSTCDPYFREDDPTSVTSYVRLWGTERTETVEHGRVPRFEKICGLVSSEVAMRHLRVCWLRRHPVYNCGRCVKCIRTRVHLKLAGAEGRCLTFPNRLDLDEVRRAPSETPIHLNYIDESIAEAQAQGLTDLAEALRVQRTRPAEDRAARHDSTGALDRFFDSLGRSYRKRRFDASLRRLKRRSRSEHLFSVFGPDRSRDKHVQEG